MINENPELADKLKEAERKKKLGGMGDYDNIKYLIDGGFPK